MEDRVTVGDLGYGAVGDAGDQNIGLRFQILQRSAPIEGSASNRADTVTDNYGFQRITGIDNGRRNSVTA